MSEDLKFENIAETILKLSWVGKEIVDGLHLDYSIEKFARWRRVIEALQLIRKGENIAALHVIAPSLTLVYPIRGDRIEVRIGHYTIVEGSNITPEAIIEGIKRNEHILLALLLEDLEAFLRELENRMIQIRAYEFDLQRLKDTVLALASKTKTQQQQDP